MYKSVKKDKNTFKKHLEYLSTNKIGWAHDYVPDIEKLNIDDEFNIEKYWNSKETILINVKEKLDIYTTITNRKSTLLSNHDKQLSKEQLLILLNNTIFCKFETRVIKDKMINYRSYPSGGSLYPVEFFLKIWKVKGLKNGYYYYNIKNQTLQLLSDKMDFDQYKGSSPVTLYEYSEFDILDNDSSIQIIFFANYKNTFNKYGSLSSRLILLEIGHCAQNILLGATEMKINALPVLGLFTDILKNEFNFSNNDWIKPEYIIFLG